MNEFVGCWPGNVPDDDQHRRDDDAEADERLPAIAQVSEQQRARQDPTTPRLSTHASSTPSTNVIAAAMTQ